MLGCVLVNDRPMMAELPPYVGFDLDFVCLWPVLGMNNTNNGCYCDTCVTSVCEEFFLMENDDDVLFSGGAECGPPYPPDDFSEAGGGCGEVAHQFQETGRGVGPLDCGNPIEWMIKKGILTIFDLLNNYSNKQQVLRADSAAAECAHKSAVFDDDGNLICTWGCGQILPATAEGVADGIE